MNIETLNEKIKACKFVGHENIIEVVEGDVIVPDIKPDILSLINTDGNVFVNKREVLDGKVKLDGAIEVFAVYIADDEKTSIKGLNALLNFSENITIPEAKEGMVAIVNYKLIGIEHKILNSRKISVKCSIEVDIKVIGEEELEITKDILEPGNIQYKKEEICLSELVGAVSQCVDLKENIMLDDANLPISEILKTKLNIINCGYKISYNKVLVKADLSINVVYVADNESMSIESFNTLVPIAGFVDFNGVSDKDLISIDTTLNSAYIKPVYQDLKANGISIEAQINMCVKAYGEKKIETLADLYNPVYEMNIENQKIVLKQSVDAKNELIDLSQILSISELTNSNLLDVTVIPNISEMKKSTGRVTIEGNVNLEILYYDTEKRKIDMKKIELPYQKTFDSCCEDINLVISNLEYILRDNGQLDLKLVLKIICEDVNNINLNLITKIEQTETKNIPVASMVIYYVQAGDTLWNISKKFKTTIELIKISNNLKNDILLPGQQLIIPKVVDKIEINPLI